MKTATTKCENNVNGLEKKFGMEKGYYLLLLAILGISEEEVQKTKNPK